MQQGLYSERFVVASSAGAWQSFSVPAGKRAVVMVCVLANGMASSIVAAALAGPAVIYQGSIPANTTLVLANLRVVGYGTEQISAHVGTAGAYVTLGGYLFDDVTGRTEGYPTVDTGPPEWLLGSDSEP